MCTSFPYVQIVLSAQPQHTGTLDAAWAFTGAGSRAWADAAAEAGALADTGTGACSKQRMLNGGNFQRGLHDNEIVTQKQIIRILGIIVPKAVCPTELNRRV